MNTSLIDRPTLDKLQVMIGGDVEDLRELIADFLADLPEQIQKMQTALDGNDLRALRIAAHNTKSNCRDFGALELAGLCTTLERQCGLGDVEGLNEQVASIASESMAVVDAIQHLDLHDGQ